MPVLFEAFVGLLHGRPEGCCQWDCSHHGAGGAKQLYREEVGHGHGHEQR